LFRGVLTFRLTGPASGNPRTAQRTPSASILPDDVEGFRRYSVGWFAHDDADDRDTAETGDLLAVAEHQGGSAPA
jgi:hypothetical protein